METKIVGNVTFSPPLKSEDSYRKELKETQEAFMTVTQSIKNIENKLDECLNFIKQNYRGNNQSIAQSKEPQVYLYTKHLKDNGAKATIWWGTAVSRKNSSKLTYNSGVILTKEPYYDTYINLVSLYNVLQSWVIIHSPQTCDINIFTSNRLLHSLLEEPNGKTNKKLPNLFEDMFLLEKILKELFFYYKKVNCTFWKEESLQATMPEKLINSLNLAIENHCK